MSSPDQRAKQNQTHIAEYLQGNYYFIKTITTESEQKDFTVVNQMVPTMPSLASSRKQHPRQQLKCYQFFCDVLSWSVRVNKAKENVM